MKVLALLLSLSLLVISHEFGHFLFARLFKTRVRRFYLFFNWKFSILKAKKFGGKWHFLFFNGKTPDSWDEKNLAPEDQDNTLWGIGWIPLGGYCDIAGMIDETKGKDEMASEPQQWEYRMKKPWQRLCIISGGVLVNFISALLIYTCIFAHWGKDELPLRNAALGYDYHELLLAEGFQNGDIIYAIDGKEMTIRPLSQSQLEALLYKRWVDRSRHLVDSLSGGRLAYVHVKAMNSASFRQVYSDLLSDKNRNRDAVIVDERYNGGGWLHDDLCTLLSGRQYQSFVPHGQYVGYDPYNKWVKPSCVLVCEDDYSNGHGFPWVYRELGIGKLIGTPVAGTMTAVWWETLMDRSLVFGIPQVGCQDMRGKFCENNELMPDIEVYNTPEDYINGRDRQLEAAVEEMMRQIKK